MKQPPSATRAEPAQPQARLIANLLAQIALGMVMMTLCLPSMQDWGSLFAAEPAAVQLTFSAYVAAYGVLQLVYGPLSDRYGRRPILLAGLLLALGASLLACLASSLAALSVARLLQGAGGAAGIVVGRSMIHDHFRGHDRTRMMAYVGMTMGVCPPTASIVGGYLHVHLGWQSNFVLMTVLCLALLVAAYRGVPRAAAVARAPLPAATSTSPVIAFRELLGNRRFVAGLVILACTTACFYVMLSGAPLVLGAYGVGPEGVGFYIMFGPLSFITGNFLSSRLVGRLSARSAIAVGQVLTLSCPVLMLTLAWAGWHAPLAFALPLILLGLGHGLLVPPVLSGALGAVPAIAGTAAGVIGLMQQVLGAVGAYSVGWAHHNDATAVALLMMAFTLVSVVAQRALVRG